MATYILGACILVAFIIGIRHICRNFSSGKSDCCGSGGAGGCGGCGGHCGAV